MDLLGQFLDIAVETLNGLLVAFDGCVLFIDDALLFVETFEVKLQLLVQVGVHLD